MAQAFDEWEDYRPRLIRKLSKTGDLSGWLDGWLDGWLAGWLDGWQWHWIV